MIWFVAFVTNGLILFKKYQVIFRDVFNILKFSYNEAIAEISTFTNLGRFATSTVSRAGAVASLK